MLNASRTWGAVRKSCLSGPSHLPTAPRRRRDGSPGAGGHAIIATPAALCARSEAQLEPGMSIVVRDVREHELDSVLALNNAAGPAILPLDAARLRHFFDTAE